VTGTTLIGQEQNFIDTAVNEWRKLIIGFQVTVENVGDVFFETQCISFTRWRHAAVVMRSR